MRKTALFVTAFLLSVTASADAPEGTFDDDPACMDGPISQFGRYIGDWKIDDESFARDGSGWSPGNGARWVFSCLGDGTGVQDFWLPNDGGFGTNIRIWDANTESWDIVWAAQRLEGLMEITAKMNKNGAIVMDILHPVQDPPRRITFLPPHENGWNWVMEMSFDAGESWTEVYRIKATPWEG